MAQERLRFIINDDLILLHGISLTNPYQNVNLWKEIHNKKVFPT